MVEIDAAPVENVGIGDFAPAAANWNVDAVIGGQMLELRQQILAEERRARDAAGVGAGLGHPGERAGQSPRGLLARVGDP